MQNSSKTNCSKAEITGKNYKANRTLRVRVERKNLESLKNQGILGSFFVLEYILNTKMK